MINKDVMSQVFVSYKRVDKDKVFPLVHKMESELGIRFWVDLEGIESDEQFTNVIINAINECEVFLFMFSKAHERIIDTERDFTVRELNFAHSRYKHIVFIELESCKLPDWFDFNFPQRQVTQANDNRAMDKLIADIRKWLHLPQPVNQEEEDYCQSAPRSVKMSCPQAISRKSAIPSPPVKSDGNPSNKSKEPFHDHVTLPKPIKRVIWSRLFGKRYDDVYSSVFAPAETKQGTHLLIQVYLHLYEDSEKVIKIAEETDKKTHRFGHIPCRLRKGDAVDIMLSIYGDTLLFSQKKTLSWQGFFTKCSFNFLVPKDMDDGELSCTAVLAVNGAQVGEMTFIVHIVEDPKELNSEIFSRQYKKIFISYAHQDEEMVKMIAKAYDAQGVDYFFDRDNLKPGDIFPIEIEEYINSADRFVLCWSANAEKSDYVKEEIKYALKRAFPQIQPIDKAPLSIYPMSIKPRANNLPENMKDIYHFEVL